MYCWQKNQLTKSKTLTSVRPAHPVRIVRLNKWILLTQRRLNVLEESEVIDIILKGVSTAVARIEAALNSHRHSEHDAAIVGMSYEDIYRVGTTSEAMDGKYQRQRANDDGRGGRIVVAARSRSIASALQSPTIAAPIAVVANDAWEVQVVSAMAIAGIGFLASWDFDVPFFAAAHDVTRSRLALATKLQSHRLEPHLTLALAIHQSNVPTYYFRFLNWLRPCSDVMDRGMGNGRRGNGHRPSSSCHCH